MSPPIAAFSSSPVNLGHGVRGAFDDYSADGFSDALFLEFPGEDPAQARFILTGFANEEPLVSDDDLLDAGRSVGQWTEGSVFGLFDGRFDPPLELGRYRLEADGSLSALEIGASKDQCAESLALLPPVRQGGPNRLKLHDGTTVAIVLARAPVSCETSLNVTVRSAVDTIPKVQADSERQSPGGMEFAQLAQSSSTFRFASPALLSQLEAERDDELKALQWFSNIVAGP